MRKVMVFGTFDGLHAGHRDFFRQAKRYGDFLIVVVARDDTVQQVKGHRPRQSERARLTSLQSEPLVDQAVLGGHGDKMAVIRKFKPGTVCFGYDQNSFTKEFKNYFPDIPVVRLKAYKPEEYKSSYQ